MKHDPKESVEVFKGRNLDPPPLPPTDVTDTLIVPPPTDVTDRPKTPLQTLKNPTTDVQKPHHRLYRRPKTLPQALQTSKNPVTDVTDVQKPYRRRYRRPKILSQTLQTSKNPITDVTDNLTPTALHTLPTGPKLRHRCYKPWSIESS